MTVDPAVVPGFLLLLAELAALAVVGFIVARVVLRQADDRVALAQGLVVGPALWGLITNFVLYAVPGLAGAAVGWGLTLTLGAVLAWRAPKPIGPRPRVAAGFALAVLALMWVALASRQQLTISDPHVYLGVSAWMQAGGFPPEAPWNPGVLLPYHHATELLVGLLTPPVGPDLAFVSELLGVYGWTSFTLVVVTLLAARGSWRVALVLAPLLLTGGLWTWAAVGPGILQGPFPSGLPEAGLRASLAEIYWPTADQPWRRTEAVLPNVWKPQFPLAYALTIVVAERAAQGKRRSWRAHLTLAGLVGWIGLLSTTMAPVSLLLWAGLEAAPLGQAWRARALTWRAVVAPSAGLALAVALLLAGGGAFTGMLLGSASPGLSFWWDGSPGDWRVLGVFDPRPGGVALLALGPVAVAGIAALLARRDRLVLTLAVGAALLTLAWLLLRYESYPVNINRMAGHARNLALVALLLALSARLVTLRPRWRYAAGALLVGLIVWPTVVTPGRNLALALGQGVEVANAGSLRPAATEIYGWGRAAMPAVSERVVTYVRDHAALNARVLVPEPPHWNVLFATGRPNGVGYANMPHQRYVIGPEFMDARDYLEPGAIERLGFDYVYATDAWVEGLPERARRWLADPELFEPVVRDGDVVLYRVRPAFLALEAPPTPASFEALLQAVPPGALVYWPTGAPFETDTTLRIASVLSPEAELFGVLKYMQRRAHALSSLSAEPLGAQTPDLVILPREQEPWMFPPESRQPIWWKHEMAVYAPGGAVPPIMPPPDSAPPEPPPISVGVSDVRQAAGQISFTLTVDDHSPERWAGQDWVLINVDESPWTIPQHLDGGKPVVEQWFAGQVVRGRGTTTHGYVYDAASSTLAVRTGDGGFRTEESSAGMIGPGSWTLALRLRQEVDRGTYLAHEVAAFIPVLKATITEDGAVSYEVYDDLLEP